MGSAARLRATFALFLALVVAGPPPPRQVQGLIYYHECGHILLGQSETSADCYAVKRARREGWLNDQALDDVCAVFNIAGHGPVHPDPQARCDQLRQCFAKRGVTARGGDMSPQV